MDPQSPLASSISVEENLFIRTGCRLLESDTKQGPFAFWGKVFGTQNDYYVIQASTLHPFRAPVTYYSRDARIWQMLPLVSAILKKKSPRLSGMFTGDPSFTSHFVEYRYTSEAYYEPTTTPVKEEERLAYLVYSVDNEATIFPKGAVGLNEKGFLVRNPTYSGMSYDHCRDFHSYVVFKPAFQSGIEKSSDVGIADPDYRFLRPLLAMEPADPQTTFGSWVFRDAMEMNCVLMENALWPGLYFWQNVGTPNYGRCYIGRGDKEIDAPFILGSSLDQELVVDIGIYPEYDYKAIPETALKEADEAFLADEERRKELLPPLPVKEDAPGEVEGESKGEETSGAGGDTTEQEMTEGEPTSAEVTDVSEAEAEETEA
ncbi:radial spoke head protein 9 homolog [Paramacrobiotus metropolitanus]|uniref:radial spoke head protein 9 homolog n=1 Tax=Paramacrobiotus metropolitanus TaxID=2943436 RepID=UPI002446036F|nr:radial spoke head protein 9 homolog [Paramacrobiotus metropolitanus]